MMTVLETRMLNALETAWGIIANVSEGDWKKQPDGWQEAAARWRDEQWHPLLSDTVVVDARRKEEG